MDEPQFKIEVQTDLSEQEQAITQRWSASWPSDPSEEHDELFILTARPAGSNKVAAFGRLTRSRVSWNLHTAVEPSHDRADGAFSELVGYAESLIQERGGGFLEIWADQSQPQPGPLFAPHRNLLRMSRTLPVAESAELSTRPFICGQDDEAFLKLNNAAFAEHPDQGNWDDTTLRARLSKGWFDPNGLLLHESDGELAGFIWTKVHQYCEPPMGELYVLGVKPDCRGKGLGRKLLAAGLIYLSELGLPKAILYVDAKNPSALRIYEAAGFTREVAMYSHIAQIPSSARTS